MKNYKKVQCAFSFRTMKGEQALKNLEINLKSKYNNKNVRIIKYLHYKI